MALRSPYNPYPAEVRKSDEALVARRAELADRRNPNWIAARMKKSSNPRNRSGRLTEHTEALLEDAQREQRGFLSDADEVTA